MNKISLLVTAVFLALTPFISVAEITFNTPVNVSRGLQLYSSDILYRNYQVSPDGNFVVYHYDVDRALSEPPRIYSENIDGSGVPNRLANDTLVFGDEIFDFAVSSDSKYVLYRAGRDDFIGPLNLYSTSINGGAAVKLNSTLTNTYIIKAVITPDISQVVFSTRDRETSTSKLYKVPIGGGVPIELVGVDGAVTDFKLSPDGEIVVYEVSNMGSELFSLSINGGKAVKLNVELTDHNYIDEFDFTPDSSNLIYTTANGSIFYHRNSIFSVSLVDAVVTKLSDIDLSFDTRFSPPIKSFEITPDSQSVILPRAGTGNDEIVSISITGGNIVRLTTPDVNPLGRGTRENHYEVTSDGTRVIYLASGALFVSNISNGNAIQLVDNVQSFELSADGDMVVFKTDSENLYSVHANGGELVRLNKLDDSTRIRDYKISPNGKYAVFQERSSEFVDSDIYGVPLDTGVGRLKIINSRLRPRGGRIDYFDFSPNGDHVIYIASARFRSVFELFSTKAVEGEAELCLPIIVELKTVVICL